MTAINLHIGYDPAALKARFLDAVCRAEGDGPIVPEIHITFESWEALAKVMSGKRLELLRHVDRTPAASIADLARALGRDYKRVHQDVGILANAGLLDRTETGGVCAAYDGISALIQLTPAA